MRWWLAAVALECAACGGMPPSLSPVGGALPAVRAHLSGFNDGTGSVALAALVRVDRGVLGDGEISGEVLDDEATRLAVFTIPAGTSTTGQWWPSVPFARDALLQVRVRSELREETLSVRAPSRGGLDSADPSLAMSGSSFGWMPVAGATGYRCAFDGTQLSALSVQTACDVPPLPNGGHELSVHAFSISPRDDSELPPKASFDVSLARTAWNVGTTPFQLRATLGHLNFGSAGRGLSVLASITRPDGTASQLEWKLALSGPGLPSGAPLDFTLAASERRTVVWSYDSAAKPGAWTLKATSGALVLAMPLSPTAAMKLPEPNAISADPKGNGALDVEWAPVAGAKAYYVSTWSNATGAFLTGRWVTQASASFPNGTFVSGTQGQLYVAATNADVVGTSPLPAALSVSENAFSPVSFSTP